VSSISLVAAIVGHHDAGTKQVVAVGGMIYFDGHKCPEHFEHCIYLVLRAVQFVSGAVLGEGNLLDENTSRGPA
jgi:hypothetical protein